MRRLLAITLLVAASSAEDADPAKRYEEAVRKFRAPGGKGAYSFVGDAFLAGERVGYLRLDAEPDRLPYKQGSKDHWRVYEELHLSVEGKKTGLEVTAYLEADLRVVQGKLDTHAPRTTVFWQRVRESYEALEIDREGKKTERKVPADRYMTTTKAGAVLFVRLAWPPAGRYSADNFVLAADKADQGGIVWNCQGPAKWCGGNAIIVRCRHGHQRLTFAFQPSTRDLLGVAVHEESATLWCLRTGRGLVAPAGDPLADVAERAATSPVEAAVQAALFLGERERALGERCIHWPSAYEALRAKHPDSKLTLEEFRKGFLDGVSALDLPKAPRAGVLASAPDALVEMHDARRATVTLPDVPPVEVVEVDGAWYWARLPDP